MRRLRLPFLALTTLLLSAVTSANTATAETRTCTQESPCVLKIGTVATNGTPWAQQLNTMRQRIETASEGRIQMRLFLGSSDGEVSLARQTADGTMEAFAGSIGALASLIPSLGVFELPYLFDSETQADGVIDNHLFDRVEEIMRSSGFQLFIFSENGFRDFATTGERPIRRPEDLASLQMRSQEMWIHESTYRALGGNPVAIPVAETTTALSNGNVHGFDNTPLYSQAAGWHTFARHWTRSQHIYQPAVLVYNRAWFDSLPSDLQELLLSNRAQETRAGRALIRAVNPALVQNLSASGINVVELTAEERAAFQERSQSVYDEFRRRVPDGAPLLDIILQHR